LAGEGVDSPRRREPWLWRAAANLRVSLQPINKVVLLQTKKFPGSSDDFSAIDCPLLTNLIGKSSVLLWQQEDCDQQLFSRSRGHTNHPERTFCRNAIGHRKIFGVTLANDIHVADTTD